MADTLIFKIDTTPTVSALQDVNDLLTQSKTKLKELTDAGKQQTNEYISQNAEVKALEKEQRALNNVLVQQTSATKIMTQATEDNIKAGKAQENSIAENRKAYNALYNQLLQTAKPTQEQIKTAKELNKTLKEQEAALGNTTRNVGNYGQGFSEAGKQINLFGVNIGEVSKGLEAAKAGFTAAGGGVKGFSAALATTGLPLIIMGVQALISAFETFEPVADAVEDTINGISNAFKGLLGGGSMSGAIKAGQELTDVMRDLEDTTAAFTITQERANREIRMLQIIASDRTKSEKERLKALEDADKVQKDLYDKEVARVDALLEKQKNALKEQTGLKDFELEILSTTDNAEDETYKKLLKRAEDKLKIDKKALGEYQKTVLAKEKLDTQNLVFEEQRVKLSNRIIEKGEAQAEKAQAAREKASDEAQAAKDKADQAEATRLQKLEALETEFQLSERERLNKSFEDKLKTITGNGERERLLRLDIVAAQEAALKKFDEDADAKKEAKRLELLAKEFNDKIAFNQKQLQLDLNAVDLSVATEKEKERRKAEIQLAALEEQLKLTKQFLGPEGSLTKEQLQGIKAIEQAIAMAKNNLKPKEEDPSFGKSLGLDKEGIKEAQNTLSEISKALQAVTDIVNMGFETRLNNIDATKNAEIDAINQSTASEEDKAKKIEEIEREAAMARYEIELKQFEANKATSIIQTIISTAQAVIAQFANPVPFAGAILSALAAATGAAQIALIASQPPPPRPAFATGVIGLDGAGTATSDSIDARLSRGESVMTAKATERFAPVLAQMEMAVGNRPNFQLGNRKFATGYIPTTDGGYSDRAMSNEVNNASTMAKMVSDSIAKMPQPKLVYDEFTNFVNNRNQSVNLSEL
jgi:hypothetical protein